MTELDWLKQKMLTGSASDRKNLEQTMEKARLWDEIREEGRKAIKKHGRDIPITGGFVQNGTERL